MNLQLIFMYTFTINFYCILVNGLYSNEFDSDSSSDETSSSEYRRKTNLNNYYPSLHRSNQVHHHHHHQIHRHPQQHSHQYNNRHYYRQHYCNSKHKHIPNNAHTTTSYPQLPVTHHDEEDNSNDKKIQDIFTIPSVENNRIKSNNDKEIKTEDDSIYQFDLRGDFTTEKVHQRKKRQLVRYLNNDSNLNSRGRSTQSLGTILDSVLGTGASIIIGSVKFDPLNNRKYANQRHDNTPGDREYGYVNDKLYGAGSSFGENYGHREVNGGIYGYSSNLGNGQQNYDHGSGQGQYHGHGHAHGHGHGHGQGHGYGQGHGHSQGHGHGYAHGHGDDYTQHHGYGFGHGNHKHDGRPSYGNKHEKNKNENSNNCSDDYDFSSGSQPVSEYNKQPITSRPQTTISSSSTTPQSFDFINLQDPSTFGNKDSTTITASNSNVGSDFLNLQDPTTFIGNKQPITMRPPSNHPQSFPNQPQPTGQQPFPSGPQPFPSGPQPFPSEPQHFPSGPQPFPSGPQPFPSGPQPFPSGPQPFPSGPQPFPSGTQPFPSGSQPFPSELKPIPGKLQPFPSGSQPFPTASQPFPTGPQPFPTASQTFPKEQIKLDDNVYGSLQFVQPTSTVLDSNLSVGTKDSISDKGSVSDGSKQPFTLRPHTSILLSTTTHQSDDSLNLQDPSIFNGSTGGNKSSYNDHNVNLNTENEYDGAGEELGLDVRVDSKKTERV